MGEGTEAIAISPDSQYLATMSASKTRVRHRARRIHTDSHMVLRVSQNMQVVSVWDWTVESEGPLCQAALGPDYSYQTHMAFHHQDPYQLVSNSEDLTVFYNWVRHWPPRPMGLCDMLLSAERQQDAIPCSPSSGQGE